MCGRLWCIGQRSALTSRFHPLKKVSFYELRCVQRGGLSSASTSIQIKFHQNWSAVNGLFPSEMQRGKNNRINGDGIFAAQRQHNISCTDCSERTWFRFVWFSLVLAHDNQKSNFLQKECKRPNWAVFQSGFSIGYFSCCSFMCSVHTHTQANCPCWEMKGCAWARTKSSFHFCGQIQAHDVYHIADRFFFHLPSLFDEWTCSLSMHSVHIRIWSPDWIYSDYNLHWRDNIKPMFGNERWQQWHRRCRRSTLFRVSLP